MLSRVQKGLRSGGKILLTRMVLSMSEIRSYAIKTKFKAPPCWGHFVGALGTVSRAMREGHSVPDKLIIAVSIAPVGLSWIVNTGVGRVSGVKLFLAETRIDNILRSEVEEYP